MFVYGTLEAGAKFSLGDIWNLFYGDNFCRQMINCIKAWNYLQKTLDLPLNTEIIRQAHGLVMQDEKYVLVAEYKRSPAFAGYHIFVPTSHIERYMDDAVFRFYETNKDDPIMAAANSFGEITNIHPFEDGNGIICRLI